MNKIVSTYRERKTEDKYSYVPSIDEIADNDYNLNIPHYVDNFEEEEQIDIDAVATAIESLNTDLKENETLIASLCKELNIKRPF